MIWAAVACIIFGIILGLLFRVTMLLGAVLAVGAAAVLDFSGTLHAGFGLGAWLGFAVLLQLSYLVGAAARAAKCCIRTGASGGRPTSGEET